jgi:hypothetical protein
MEALKNQRRDFVSTRMSQRQSGNVGRFSTLLGHLTLTEARNLNRGESFFDIF